MSHANKKYSIILLHLSLFLIFSANIFAQTKAQTDSGLQPASETTQTEIQNGDLRDKSKPQKFVQKKEPFENTNFKFNVDEKSVDGKNAKIENAKTAEINDFKPQFSQFSRKQVKADFSATISEKDLLLPTNQAANNSPDSPNDPNSAQIKEGFQWRQAIQQSLIFLGVQHGYAIAAQAKTRRDLKGKFFKDYADSVKSLHGWDDGGRFFTNYIAHPMQGSLTGFIYVQNSPQARRQQFGKSGDYWRSRAKAMAWTAAWSTQFELGPVSQASIGNVGLHGKQTWEDIVVTPTFGTVMLVSEDAIDRFVTQRIERRTNNFYVRIFSRMLLSPTRVFANLLRFETPWYRDRPIAH